MADDKVFRPRKATLPAETASDSPYAGVEAGRAAASEDDREGFDTNPAVKISGNVPPEFLKAMSQQRNAAREEAGEEVSQLKTGFGKMKGSEPAQEQRVRFSNDDNTQIKSSQSKALKSLIEGLKPKAIFDPIKLPSGGRFYDGNDGPIDGIVSIRAMTGEEEQILATPKFVRKGVAVNMIFQRCIEEDYKAENLLTVD